MNKYWNNETIEKFKIDFPIRFTMELVKETGLSKSTLIRFARKLNLSKIDNFKEINQEKINDIISKNHAPNPMKGVKGFIIPNSEKYHFKKGELPKVDYSKAVISRLETIRIEKLRLKYGLKQKTKLKLVNYQ